MAGAAFTRLGLLALTFSALSTAPAPPPLLDDLSASSEHPPPAHMTLRAFDAEGRPLVARARIAAASWTQRVRLKQWQDMHVIVTAHGTRVALAAGDYVVTVSRGPEWSLVTRSLHVAAAAELQQQWVLDHQVVLPGWMGADLHVHTSHSDDAIERGGVAAIDLQAEGVSIAAVTDHNFVGRLGDGVDSLPGAELTTWDPEIGHFNAFPLKRLPSWRATTPARLFAELGSDPEVFMQVNHPRLEHHIGYFALGGFDGERFADPNFHLDVDGLEVWNGYDLARADSVDALLAEWRSWMAQGHRLTATGGSDSHGASNHLPGYPRTYVQAASSKEAARALKAGRAFVTNGPLLELLVDGYGPGESVSLARFADKVDVEIAVLAPDWIRVEQAEIWVGKELAWRVEIPSPRVGQPLHFRARIRLTVAGAHTIHAMVRDGSGLKPLLGRSDVEPLAFTNPVYLLRTPPKD